MRKLAYLGFVLGTAFFGATPVARAQAQAPAVCAPECGPGQVCADGVCVAAGQAADPNAAGAPPPNYPPPAGYPAPPANGYPPPSGYPPSNGYPPPGSPAYPPPSAYAPGSYGAPMGPPAWRRGFLALPYIGLQSYPGQTGDGLGVGFRLGALLGGRIGQMLSLNGEIVIDVDNIKNNPSGATETEVELNFSPLVHIPQDNFELVFGPKLGFFAAQVSSGGTTVSVDGPVFGLNAGAFMGIGQGAAVGALLSFAWRFPHEECINTGGGDNCSTDIGSPPAIKVFGFTGAVLF